jgi:hypothetical protein
LNRLRASAPPTAEWRSIYGTVFDPRLGSYNSTDSFVRGFEDARIYYLYMDTP